MWIHFNNNPNGNASVGDCVIRALSVALDQSWDDIFWLVAEYAYAMGDMPSANAVWGEVLVDNGFTRHVLPNTCPMCYRVKDFCRDHPKGTYVLATGSHVVTVINGDFFDAWNSGSETVTYYFARG